MFCSTIIPTVNRATLGRAVCSVLQQEFSQADFEVIVVNDSGQPLPDADWQHDERVRVIDTNRRERSVARNTGAALARGQYLHFLDDDDLLLPGALAAFWALQGGNEVVWLYGSYQSVDNEGKLVEEFHPGLQGNVFASLVAGEGIPLQASLLQAKTFFAVGAYDVSPLVLGVEDRDLGRRMALAGALAYTPAVVAKIRIGQVGSTTNWATLGEGDRWGREKALRAQTAFRRLQASARSAYWRGRVSRAYYASMVWNLKQRDLFSAASRGLAGALFASTNLLAQEFWQGLRTKVQ